MKVWYEAVMPTSARSAALAVVLLACGPSGRGPAATRAARSNAPMTTFRDDLTFLEQHGEPIVLTGDGGAKVALSAEYQGRVMTSGVGEQGRSLGWINRAFIASKKTGTPFDNFGGEDRFWLGPEGGQFGLYFAPGAKFEFDAWQTPHALQEGAWQIAAKDTRAVTFKRSMRVTNWSKSVFDVDVVRTVRLLDKGDARRHLGITTDAPLVAYESDNAITNAGEAAWTKNSGLLSIWILAMYAPASDARVVIPFEPDAEGPIVNDAYFGKVPPERLDVRPKQNVVVFVGDGEHRSKIGLGPHRAKNVLGSYSAEAKLLTVIHYDRPSADAPYVNSMWEQQKDPYAGDVVNSYNDGPPAPGKPPLGGFYELETSSPGLALAPGESARHTHRTFHWLGEPSELEPIATQVLGVSLSAL
jgi:hypothetical protein